MHCKKRFDENYRLCVPRQSIEMAANFNCTWSFCFMSHCLCAVVCIWKNIHLLRTLTAHIVGSEWYWQMYKPEWQRQQFEFNLRWAPARRQTQQQSTLMVQLHGIRKTCAAGKNVSNNPISQCSSQAKLLSACCCWCSTSRVDIVHIILPKQPLSFIPCSLPTESQNSATVIFVWGNNQRTFPSVTWQNQPLENIDSWPDESSQCWHQQFSARVLRLDGSNSVTCWLVNFKLAEYFDHRGSCWLWVYASNCLQFILESWFYLISIISPGTFVTDT